MDCFVTDPLKQFGYGIPVRGVEVLNAYYPLFVSNLSFYK